MALWAWTAGCGGEALNADSAGSSDSGAKDASLETSSDATSGNASSSSSSEASSDAARGATCPGSAAGKGSLATGRVPAIHRAAASECPRTRGTHQPSTLGCKCPTDGGTCLCANCTTDSDCTQGPNGRCEANGPIAYRSCSYDECFADSDCTGGAPCECRGSSESLAANRCIGASQCAVDADCGPGGYCSPSVVSAFCQCPGSPALCPDSGTACYEGSNVTGPPPGNGWTVTACACGDSCGHGYFCHTPCDECIDDADCGDHGTCNYDVLKNAWACASCDPIP